MGTIPRLKPSWPNETVYDIVPSGPVDHILTCCVGGSTYLKEWPRPGYAYGDRQSTDSTLWADHDREVVQVLLSFAFCQL